MYIYVHRVKHKLPCTKLKKILQNLINGVLPWIQAAAKIAKIIA
jgi:hypothetical protein